ncbi:MAG: putative ubiquitin-RnfH superfamily antitoxin RatB of RatAB toxin-antitoxin module [Patiriisocius sp.]|jgi:putative ubiquitin-RnfH superfamily antitoxin RatB of RatAB toxin-antitoxin module
MDEIKIEVVYVGVSSQFRKDLTLPATSDVQHSLNASGVLAAFPELTPEVPVGIYGKKVSRSQILKDGDRVEIYRPLVFDPKQARRNRAARKTS